MKGWPGGRWWPWSPTDPSSLVDHAALSLALYKKKLKKVLEQDRFFGFLLF